MNEDIILKNSINFQKTILFCHQCGKYNINVNETIQICSCKALLKYEGRISESVKEIKQCKICSIIAHSGD
jgi:hypothetical protein